MFSYTLSNSNNGPYCKLSFDSSDDNTDCFHAFLMSVSGVLDSFGPITTFGPITAFGPITTFSKKDTKLYNARSSKVSFHFSGSIKKLSEYVDTVDSFRKYDTALLIAGYLSKQILFLLEKGVSVVGLNVDDIVVLETDSSEDGTFSSNPIFLMINSSCLFSVSYYLNDFNPYIHFMSPFMKPRFMFKDVLTLPYRVNAFESAYGAIGKLILWFLDVESDMSILYGTKLYWFLKKCITPLDNIMPLDNIIPLDNIMSLDKKQHIIGSNYYMIL